jgi:hypothetical protein
VSRPCVCDVGAVTGCPTGAETGIAVWKEDGFLAGRLALFQQLRALLARQSYSTSTGSEVVESPTSNLVHKPPDETIAEYVRCPRQPGAVR